jgi:tetratricopeptide (TPR) repeat protein
MANIIPGYEYDIFISYRQKDNKYDGWVTEFVNNLKKELEATFKEDLSIYTDENPHDGLLETHNIDKSLEGKLKCLIFIPVISQTYCDTKSFAWTHELCAFNKLAKEDQFGRDIKFSNGNVASRILPVKIHDLDQEDKMLLENELGGVLRAVEFIYKESGVNRPLKPADNKNDNQNKTDYRNQINKVANAVKEIIGSMKIPQSQSTNSKLITAQMPLRKKRKGWFQKTRIRTKILIVTFSILILTAGALSLNKFYSSEKSSNAKHENNITESPVAYEWYKKAEFREDPYDKDDLDSCIFFLTKAIETDPLFALAHAKLSMIYSFKNYFHDLGGSYHEKAFIEAEKSLFLNPDLAEGYLARAYSTWNLQDKFPHEKVIREYKKAIALKPDLDEAYHYLGVVYFHIGLVQESFKAYNKALQINPDNKIAALELASCFFFSGKKTDLERMEDIIEQTPEHLITKHMTDFWAIALIELDRLPEAENILSGASKKDSLDLLFKSAYAILLAKKGDKEGALKKIESCEKTDLNKSQSHIHHAVYQLGEAYALLGDYQKSVDKLTWAADNGFPNYPYFRDDPMLISLQQFAPYNELLEKLQIKWEKFRKVANE